MTVQPRLALVLLTAAYSSESVAHAAFGGSGDSIATQLINGALHPFIVIQHLLLLIVAGFLVGRQEPRTIEQCIVVSGLALACGLIFSTDAGSELFLVAATILTATAGLLIASDWRPGSVPTITVVALSCLIIGLDSPAPVEASTPEKIAMHIGSLLGVSAALFYAGYVTYAVRAPWLKVGLRILASWVTAVSIMLLALTIATPKESAVAPAPLTESASTLAQIDVR